MKIVLAIAATACFLGMSNIAKAQNDGNPYKYTITGDFIDGEPDPSYTAVGGKAYVQVGCAAVYEVLNTAIVVRRSMPYFSAKAILGPAAGGAAPIPPPLPAPQFASGEDDMDMMPGQKVQYSLHFDSSSGDVTTGQWNAFALFEIGDQKTGDGKQLTKIKPVTVH